MTARGLVGLALAACTAGGTIQLSTQPSAPAPSTCREAYAEYETRWRTARTEELTDLAAGDADVIEEIIFYELASLPSREEVDKLRSIYAVVDAFLWDAPWPRALAATEVAIERCGERASRP